MISLFGGSGFIGQHIMARSKFKYDMVPRQGRKPLFDETLYLISTVDNYNVFTDPCLDIETNLLILMKILKNHVPGTTFNFFSSWFVYGDAGESSNDETSLCKPTGFYSITKLCAEGLVESYCKTFGINYRILRLSNIYGPHDFRASKKKNALTWMINELKENRPIDLYDGGVCLRDYLHVYDLVRAVDVCLERAPLNEVINIGYGKSAPVGSLIWAAKHYLKSTSELRHIKTPDFHKLVQAKDFKMNTSKLTSLGFVPEISPLQGVIQLCR